MKIKIIRNPIFRKELLNIAKEQFGDFVKAVVDVEKAIMAIGGDLHADEEAVLLEKGSAQGYLWGINIYPERAGDDWIEFDSMINIRPSDGNQSRSVEDIEIQKQIRAVLNKLVTE